MRSRTFPAWIVLGIAAAGCGGGPAATKPSAQHSGVMNELPEKKGFFEIRSRGDAPAGRPSRSKKVAEHPIVVHFYGPDGTTEMSPAPTDVTIKIGGDMGSDLPLSPQPRGGFATAPGLYPTAFRGRLRARIDGQPIEAYFMIR